MSVRAMTWAFAQEDLKPGPKLVLLALADRANEEGLCWPSIPTLARKCSMGERTVQVVVKFLALCGCLQISEQFVPGTKARRGNLYQLLLARVTPIGCGGGADSAGVGGADSAPGGANGSRGGGANGDSASIDSSVKNPSGEEKSAPRVALVVSWREGFGQVWACYPRKVGKGAAEKAYQKINPAPDLLDTILRKIEAATHTAQWIKDDGEFIPHLATWLNQRRWEDEYPAPSPGPARSFADSMLRGNG